MRESLGRMSTPALMAGGLAGTGQWNLRLRLPLDRQGCEEVADVLDKQAGRFERGEVAAGLEVPPVHDVVGLLGVAADGDVPGGSRRPRRGARPGPAGRPSAWPRSRRLRTSRRYR